MRRKNYTIFHKVTILIFSLLAILGTLFITITYFATSYYHQASTQLLNKDVAAHIAIYTSPFTNTGIDKKKADSVFQSAMVLSPAAEVYFLNTAGKVIYYHASEKDIQEWHIPTAPLRDYIDTKGEKYITGTDPKDPSHKKIFSAASVNGKDGMLGYIYVILNSKKSESIMGLLLGSHILSLVLKAFLIILLLSFIFSFIYLKRLGRNFQQMIGVLQRFEGGDFTARFNVEDQTGILPVTTAFNKMANLLADNIGKLTRSEQERKIFIAAISHDLRTPLSIARGYTETLLIKNIQYTEAEQKDYAKLIYAKILQIENMVNQLFELSKIDAVEFKPQVEPFVFSEVVQEAINTHQLIAAERNIDLRCIDCHNIIWINADVSMIERVLQNLIDSALKNTPEGGVVKITIATDKSVVVFTIENEGPRLGDDLLQWINTTQDADSLSTTRPQKTGLGLLIVQKILYHHQTRLNARLTTQQNIFTFEFPLYKLPS